MSSRLRSAASGCSETLSVTHETLAVAPDPLQRRTVGVLAAGQVLVGIGFGATVSLGALLAAHISGSDALSGMATASVTLGAALAAIPLARLAARRGRRFALTLGNLLALIGIALVITAASISSFALMLGGVVLIGMGNAGTLQSRFAATDLSRPRTRGRDLSIVVWSTTIGGVLGPLLLDTGEQIGAVLGMPQFTGSYLFSIVAQTIAFVLYLTALRPDPLQEAARRRSELPVTVAVVQRADHPKAVRYAIFAVAGSHAVMASVMAMTPIHLAHMAHGTRVTQLVGITLAMHVAGMYALAPVFGVLSDRIGRVPVILAGQALLGGAVFTAILFGENPAGVMVALILLGVGWSAATVAGSALLTDASAPEKRPARQGTSDALMSLSAALGAVAAGGILELWRYAGLAACAAVVVVLIALLSPAGRLTSRE